jgi:transposase
MEVRSAGRGGPAATQGTPKTVARDREPVNTFEGSKWLDTAGATLLRFGDNGHERAGISPVIRHREADRQSSRGRGSFDLTEKQPEGHAKFRAAPAFVDPVGRAGAGTHVTSARGPPGSLTEDVDLL